MSLSGVLSDFSIGDVLTLVGSATKTGSVLVGTADGRFGKVYVDAGYVVGADVFGESDLASAVCELLRLTEGSFRFSPGDAPAVLTPPRAVPEVLADAQDLAAEWCLIEQVVPSLRATLRLAEDAPAEEVAISRGGWAVLAHIGAAATPEMLTERLGGSHLATCRVIKTLAEAGLLHVTEAAEPVVADSTVEDLGSALDDVEPEPVAEPVAAEPEPVAEPVAAEPEPVVEPVATEPEPAPARAVVERDGTKPVARDADEIVELAALEAESSAEERALRPPVKLASLLAAPGLDLTVLEGMGSDARTRSLAELLAVHDDGQTPVDVDVRNSLMRELGGIGSTSVMYEVVRQAAKQTVVSDPTIPPKRRPRRTAS